MVSLKVEKSDHIFSTIPKGPLNHEKFNIEEIKIVHLTLLQLQFYPSIPKSNWYDHLIQNQPSNSQYTLRVQLGKHSFLDILASRSS